MTQKQSWSRAQNVCNKVSQDGKTGNRARRIMRKLSTTKEMKARYSNKVIGEMTHSQCKRTVRSDIASIDKQHKKDMRAQWKKLPKKRRGTYKKWLNANKHANPIDVAFKDDVEYLFNSE